MHTYIHIHIHIHIYIYIYITSCQAKGKGMFYSQTKTSFDLGKRHRQKTLAATGQRNVLFTDTGSSVDFADLDPGAHSSDDAPG